MFWLFFLVGVVEALCPVLFHVVSRNEGSTVVDYGSYFYRNGSQYPGPFYMDGAAELYETYPCAMISVMITDDVDGMSADMSDWMHYECRRLLRSEEECFRSSEIQMTVKPHQIYRPGVAPTISVTCEDRNLQDCNDQNCHWFDVILGCRPQGYCNLGSRNACLMRREYCKWHLGKCLTK